MCAGESLWVASLILGTCYILVGVSCGMAYRAQGLGPGSITAYLANHARDDSNASGQATLVGMYDALNALVAAVVYLTFSLQLLPAAQVCARCCAGPGAAAAATATSPADGGGRDDRGQGSSSSSPSESTEVVEKARLLTDSESESEDTAMISSGGNDDDSGSRDGAGAAQTSSETSDRLADAAAAAKAAEAAVLEQVVLSRESVIDDDAETPMLGAAAAAAANADTHSALAFVDDGGGTPAAAAAALDGGAGSSSQCRLGWGWKSQRLSLVAGAIAVTLAVPQVGLLVSLFGSVGWTVLAGKLTKYSLRLIHTLALGFERMVTVFWGGHRVLGCVPSNIPEFGSCFRLENIVHLADECIIACADAAVSVSVCVCPMTSIRIVRHRAVSCSDPADVPPRPAAPSW